MKEERPPYVGTEDLEQGLPATPLRRVPQLLAMVLATLLIFNSDNLLGWAQRLPSNPKNEWIAARAADWHEAMQGMGLAAPMAWVRERLAVSGGR
jgi:hypothetical protein